MNVSESSKVIVQGNLTNSGVMEITENSTAKIVGNFDNSASLNLTTTSSTVIVQGNYTQPENGVVSFGVNLTSNAQINVSHSVQINGTVQMCLNEQLPTGATTTFFLINYGTGSKRRSVINVSLPNVSNSQIKVVPNYNMSTCDLYSAQVVNMQGSLGVALTRSFSGKCGGANIGLIIGLSVGIPLFTILVLVTILLIKRRREESEAINLVKEREMNNLRGSAINLTGSATTNPDKEKRWGDSAVAFDGAK